MGSVAGLERLKFPHEVLGSWENLGPEQMARGY